MINNILEFEIFNIGGHRLKLYSIFVVVVIFLATKILLWGLKKAIEKQHQKHHIDTGNSYAIFQIVRYILWIISIAFILETLGVKVTVLIAGSAALLVGVGLGLQQTFNDVLSGMILLFEGSIKVDDVLEIDDDVVVIQNIGLRTSKVLNRDNISIIIPNSLITTNKVINWSYQSKKTRFKIDVGVAYGSDLELVKKILEKSVLEHHEISQKNFVDVRFVDFGNSSLDFEVLFFSKNVFRIEKVKSEIRFIINKNFIENNIIIPFPQSDVHIKKKG